ncbi:QRFP-like peptide receptor [Procambarus clarkii]|uniref:QRFP-like peptide receptor n=1 Tax=Procambarus clarkii TaxID=6728 RepID=UPI001E670F3D|nr:G-protein coupled receptor 54-like [Procambarus clarkii]XP_045610630.1 G-protein coupled receptor 54-like [Procambarus clarkii]XP_045610631.1 G-protein coupled receptor 54-like [Procambarus clarkii]XP_045610632.1 G-protein coupled receptor 54-like [Procambarus clarkii]
MGGTMDITYEGLLLELTTSTLPLDLNATLAGGGLPGTFGNVSWHSCDSSEPLLMRENFPNPNLEDALRLDVYESLQVALMVLVVAMSVSGNLAVMVVVYLNSFLHSTINYYLVNLAVADLLISVFCWPTLANRLTHPLYLLGRPLCKISVLAQGTCVTVSVLTLATVACDRVYAVLLPMRARSSSSRPLTIIIILWLFSFAVAFPSFYVRETRVFQWNDLVEESCGDIICTAAHLQVFTYYRILLLATLFFVPGAVMVLAYTLIVFRLWCVRRGPSDPHSQATCPEPHTRAKRKIVKMTAMVLLAFTACWAPLHSLIMYDLVVDHPMPDWFETALFWAYCLGYSNSALNPLLYGGFSDNFRLGFRKILARWRRTSDQHHNRSAGTASTFLSRFPISSRTSNSISRQTSGSLPRTPFSHQTSCSSHTSSGSANTSHPTSSSAPSRETSKRKQITNQNPDVLSRQPLVETNELRDADTPSGMGQVFSIEVSQKSQQDSGFKIDGKLCPNQSHDEGVGAQINSILEGSSTGSLGHGTTGIISNQLNDTTEGYDKTHVDHIHHGRPKNALDPKNH